MTSHSIPPLVSLDYVLCYRQDRLLPEPHLIPPHQEWVEVVLGGHGWVHDGKTTRAIEPGDIIWQSPGDWTIFSPEFEDPFETFSSQFTVRRARGMGVRRFSKWNDLGEIKALIRETCRFQWDETLDRASLRDYLYAKLLFQVRLYERSLRTAHYPPPLAKALARIETDFAQPLSLDDLARECGWTAMYLQAQFRKYLNIAPHQMLIQKRLQAAKTRLVSSNDPLKKIAADCGFTSLVSFSHAFKVQTGQTPGIFRDGYRR